MEVVEAVLEGGRDGGREGARKAGLLVVEVACTEERDVLVAAVGTDDEAVRAAVLRRPVEDPARALVFIVDRFQVLCRRPPWLASIRESERDQCDNDEKRKSGRDVIDDQREYWGFFGAY